MSDVALQTIDTTHFKLNQESDNTWISRMKCEPSTSYSKLLPTN